MLLNAILKPTARFVAEKEGKSVVHKTTVTDATNSSIIHLRTINDLELARENKLKTSILNKNTIQPYIFVVGSEITTLKEFYVSFGNNILKFNSFLSALDICFKVFQIFQLKYPKESALSWLFIQNHIFEISTIFDEKSPTLALFIQDLKK